MNIRALLSDLVRLRLPVTAAALATTIVGLIEPFGVDLSAQTVRITAALTIIGIIADQVNRYRSK